MAIFTFLKKLHPKIFSLKKVFRRPSQRMQCINGFLGAAKEFVAIDGVKKLVVLGNESCDLDSAVSSMTLAFYINLNLYKKQEKLHTIPVLNIPRADLPLKTEVTFWLRQKGICLDRIVCKDEIDLEDLKARDMLDIILVDHHHSPWTPFASKVYDHRPLDPSVVFSETCEKKILIVGSCATLIADLILADESFEFRGELARMLYEVIVLDTVNLSKEADKATIMDFMVIAAIEALLQIESPDELRASIFTELVKARSDIAQLDAQQLLRKDLKIIKNDTLNKVVAIPGFPILVTDFVKMDGAEVAVRTFAAEHAVNVVLLMGMKVIDAKVSRDLAIINIDDPKLFGKILTEFIDDDQLDLEVRLCYDFMGGEFFEQRNVKASRKQILPLAKRVLDNYVPPVERTREDEEGEYQEFLNKLEEEYKEFKEGSSHL